MRRKFRLIGIEELSSMIPGEDTTEDTEASNSEEEDWLSGQVDTSGSTEEEEMATTPGFQEDDVRRIQDFQEEGETFILFEDSEDQWITKEEDNPWLNWDPKWMECRTYNVTCMEKDSKLDWAPESDYVDGGFPRFQFLRIYPETHGSRAEGIWSELPGYTVGRIGFMMLLTKEGTAGYVQNNNVWPGHWWITPEARYELYLGLDEGDRFLSEQWTWDTYVYRGEEEKEFLAKVVASMVVCFGRFSWEGFCWAAREEQKTIGENYKTFWTDWERIIYDYGY